MIYNVDNWGFTSNILPGQVVAGSDAERPKYSTTEYNASTNSEHFIWLKLRNGSKIIAQLTI